MNGNTRKKKFDKVSKRDGPYCRNCGALPSEKQLVLDHVNNDPTNNILENLQLLCRRCNYLKNPRRPLDLCESEGESSDPSELEVSRLKEPGFRKFVCQQLNEHGKTPQKDLIDSASEELGISPVTGKRYLDKMVSSRGILRRWKSVNTILIDFKRELPFA